jgi:hypothetical protein
MTSVREERERKKNKVVDLLFLGALNVQIPVH